MSRLGDYRECLAPLGGGVGGGVGGLRRRGRWTSSSVVMKTRGGGGEMLRPGPQNPRPCVCRSIWDSFDLSAV